MRKPLALAALAALVLTAVAAAASFPVRVVSETASTITLGWDAQAGADGYRFYADGQAVSRTFDPSRQTVRFAKGAASYDVEVLHVTAGDRGSYPPPVAPPTPPASTLTGAQFESRCNVAGAVLDNVTVNAGGTLSCGAANVTVRNSKLSGIVLDIDPGANGFHLDNTDIANGGFNIWGADNVTVEKGTFDGGGRVSSNQMWDTPAGNGSKNVTIRGNSFSNYRGGDCSVHGEALFVGGLADGVLIEGNTFNNNGCTSHIFFSHFGNSALSGATTSVIPRNVCVRGNTFGPRFSITYVDINFRDEVVAVGPAASGIKVQPGAATTNPEFNAAC